jgi:hypothetical protein
MTLEAHTENEQAYSAPYERLRQREATLLLSSTPHDDAKILSQRFELQPSAALRFEKAYVTHSQQQHRLHVICNNNKERERSADIAVTKQYIKEAMDDMVGIITDSQSAFFPTGKERENNVRHYLEKALNEPHPEAGQRPSDFRFLTAVRQQLDEQPETQELFDTGIIQMQKLVDGLLDAHKITQYTNPLLLKQSKDIARTLSESGVKDSQAIGKRILNIFTKQVDLVQAKRSEELAKA